MQIISNECCFSPSTGVIVSSTNGTIPNNNMSRISLEGFLVSGPTDYHVYYRLYCISERTQDYISEYYGCLVGDGHISIQCTRGGRQAISPSAEETRGWLGRRGQKGDHRLFSLIRRLENAEEGYFNCVMTRDIYPLSGLYILYSSK